jgi:glycosyltransferase involved in cell wall biosynthesis
MKLHVWAPGFNAFEGGIGVFSRALATGLRDIGHEVFLLSKFDVPGTWQNFNLWGAGHTIRNLQNLTFAWGLLSNAAKQRPNMIVSAHPNFAPIARLAKRLFGIPYAVIAHGIDIEEGMSWSRKNAVRRADRIIAVSKWTRQRLVRHLKVDPEWVSILPNTIDETVFIPQERSTHLMARYGISTGDKVILTVGRMAAHEGYKGYDRVIQALPAVNQALNGRVRYVLVGQGDDQPRVKALAREQGVENQVVFAGFVSDSQLASHYRLADVFAMPSTGEGFGIAFLEAMACGVPVLAGDKDGSVDALANGELGRLVDPKDVQEIALGLIDLLQQKGRTVWFNPQELHNAVIRRFGHEAFRNELRRIFP